MPNLAQEPAHCEERQERQLHCCSCRIGNCMHLPAEGRPQWAEMGGGAINDGTERLVEIKPGAEVT